MFLNPWHAVDDNLGAMKTNVLSLAAVLLIGYETSTVEQPTPQAAPTQPISQPVTLVESVIGKPIVTQFDAALNGVTNDNANKVLTIDNEQIKIRLESIDYPESKHAYGTKTKQAMSKVGFW